MNYDKLCVITLSVLMEWLGNFEKYSYDTGPGCSKGGYVALSTGSKSLSVYPVDSFIHLWNKWGQVSEQFVLGIPKTTSQMNFEGLSSFPLLLQRFL